MLICQKLAAVPDLLLCLDKPPVNPCDLPRQLLGNNKKSHRVYDGLEELSFIYMDINKAKHSIK